MIYMPSLWCYVRVRSCLLSKQWCMCVCVSGSVLKRVFGDWAAKIKQYISIVNKSVSLLPRLGLHYIFQNSLVETKEYRDIRMPQGLQPKIYKFVLFKNIDSYLDVSTSFLSVTLYYRVAPLCFVMDAKF